MGYDLVAFDLDGVIVAERSSWEWVHKHFGVDNNDALLEFVGRKIDDAEFMRRDIRLWKAKNPDISLADIERILLQAKLVEGSSETIRALRERGVKTCVVSGGIDLLADHIGASCGIDRTVSNGLAADKEGRLTGEGILRVKLRDKASALLSVLDEFGIPAEKCAAVGNSWVDVTMFDVAGFSIAFNPIDEETRKAADVVVESDNLMDVLKYLQ